MISQTYLIFNLAPSILTLSIDFVGSQLPGRRRDTLYWYIFAFGHFFSSSRFLEEKKQQAKREIKKLGKYAGNIEKRPPPPSIERDLNFWQ